MALFQSKDKIDQGLLRISKELWSVLNHQNVAARALTATAEDKKPFAVYYETDTAVLIPRYYYPYVPDPTPRKDLDLGILFQGNLKPFQLSAVKDVSTCLEKERGCLLQAACGTGKTVMALWLAATMANTVLVLVDQVNIAEQWVERIKEFTTCTDVKIFGGGYEDIDKVNEPCRFKIVLAQTLMRHDMKDDPITVDLLIVDEAHVFSAPRFSAAIANISFFYSLALTATPDRKDGLEWVFRYILGRALVSVEAKAMTPRVIAYSVPFSLEVSDDDFRMFFCRVKRKMAWEYHCTHVCDLQDKVPNCGGFTYMRNQDQRLNMVGLVKTVCDDPEYLNWLHEITMQQFKAGRKVLIFGQLREPLKKLYAMGLETVGEENCGLYLGIKSKSDEVLREKAMSKALTWCTYGVANKALDVPHKDTAIFSTPKSDVRQAVGRIVRPFPNKPDPLVIDPVFVHINLFRFMHYSRRKQYRELSCQTTTIEISPKST